MRVASSEMQTNGSSDLSVKKSANSSFLNIPSIILQPDDLMYRFVDVREGNATNFSAMFRMQMIQPALEDRLQNVCFHRYTDSHLFVFFRFDQRLIKVSAESSVFLMHVHFLFHLRF